MVAAVRDNEMRQTQRVNTLFAADAQVGSSTWPVKVRNISQFGALLETSVKVDVGSSIVIKRGILRAAGEIVWRRQSAFGVRFFEPADVEQWLGVPTRDVLPVHQEATRKSSGALSDEVISKRVAEELAYVERIIGVAAAVLSDDPILRIRHCSKIQELCIAAENIRGLSDVLLSDDKMTSVEINITGPMKYRLLR